MTPIILASNSPRRRDLLALTAIPFIVLPVSVDESPIPGEDPKKCVIRLAEAKAAAALEQADRMGFPVGQIIVASDTIVTKDGLIYGKPLDMTDARRMLTELRGKTHVVSTAIAITTVQSGKRSITSYDTEVLMRHYTDTEMEEYIQSGDPLDKAGAYAIQHDGFRPVERIDGCFACVMGLPLCHLVKELESYQIYMFEDIPLACQENNNIHCPIYSTILTRYKVN